MSYKDPVLVLIPAFNEESALGDVISDLNELDLDLSILVVDDGSTDNTSTVARSAGAHHVVRLPYNLGIGGAVQTGLLFAARSGFNAVVRMDADGQHDPKDVPGMLAEIEKGVDVVIGSRFIVSTGQKSTPMRMAGIKVLSGLCYMLTGTRVRDLTSGFRVYSRKVVGYLSLEYPVDYPEPDETVMLLARKIAVREVGVTMRKRQSGVSSIYGWWPLFYMVKVSLSMIMTRIRSLGQEVV